MLKLDARLLVAVLRLVVLNRNIHAFCEKSVAISSSEEIRNIKKISWYVFDENRKAKRREEKSFVLIKNDKLKTNHTH